MITYKQCRLEKKDTTNNSILAYVTYIPSKFAVLGTVIKKLKMNMAIGMMVG